MIGPLVTLVMKYSWTIQIKFIRVSKPIGKEQQWINHKVIRQCSTKIIKGDIIE